MGLESNKNTQQKRLLKRYHTLSDYYVSDGETNRFKTPTRNNSVFTTPTKVRSTTGSFTPYSRIPAIGEKFKDFKNVNDRYQLNYHSDNDINRQSSSSSSSKIPVYRSPNVFNKSKLTNKSNNINLKRSHLKRRNTYVVLEPVVCVKDSEDLKKRPSTKHSLNLTYTKYNSNQNSDNIQEKSIVFGQKLLSRFDSDSDLYASDEMSPSSERGIRKGDANLNTLNYLLHNLKISRTAESDLLLPKNNPWLL
ncbi:hypothetical protein ILUMI_22330 [Ignelater luminosus]|uniref:Uncharacterized protein n=1 Tax=Ignelater luminosus TaxID=2038154 RepID=A0A8K0G2Q7_IGNLU|nr:hypothetical protein ILUMI_22330 [Ignelater luminosus]